MNRMKELQEKHRITVAFASKEAQRLTELGFEFGEQELLRKKLIARNDNKKKNPVGRPPGKKVKEAPKGQCKIDSFIEMDLC